MPEWLSNSTQPDADLKLVPLAMGLAWAFVLGCVVALIYYLAARPWGGRAPTKSNTPFLATLVLLSVLIAMVTIVIGGSVARAFSLVGALSIVRFRTVVEDTRDTAFVIFAVVVGMSAGAGQFEASLVGIPFVATAALLFRPRVRRAEEEYLLVLRVSAAHRPDALVSDLFGQFLTKQQLVSLTTARQGASLEATFAIQVREPDSVVVLVGELNRVEGVQGVEVRRL